MDTIQKEPKWKIFDLEWYSRRYKNFTVLIQDIYQGDFYAYHLGTGCKIGNSPNPYFDEIWYLNKYPNIKKLIQDGEYISGFDHYTKIGFKDHSPHWLFSEENYIKFNPQIMDLIGEGKPYINGYDHYLQKGDKEFLTGSYFFNPFLYLSQKDNYEEILDVGPFQYLIKSALRDCDLLKISWFFDPQWYFETYYKSSSLSSNPKFLNTLHHYLVNATPTLFSPLIDFSERYYLGCYHDLITTISKDGQGVFRNGYDHFIICGCDEKRKPNEKFNYNEFTQEEYDLVYVRKEYVNIFEYWEAKKNPDLLLKLQNLKDNLIKLGIVNFDLNGLDEVNTVIKNVEVPLLEEINIEGSSLENVELEDSKFPFWKKFDEQWYIQNYPSVISKMQTLDITTAEEYYHSYGCFEGNSPNPYFDEKWYLNKYPNVQIMINRHLFNSGFEHYCKEGYLFNDPHWLFSEDYYKKANPHLTKENLEQNGFVNGYDHFLKTGSVEGISGSLFFDSNFFLGQYHQVIQENLGPYCHYLKFLINFEKTLRVSWYFDPKWYAQAYPEVTRAINDGKYINYLHHYLANENAFDYNPTAWFDEKYYLSKYRNQLDEQKAFDKYRNGYEHFIYEGIKLLWNPSAEVNLLQYASNPAVQKDLVDNIFPNVYIGWLIASANHKPLNFIQNEFSEEEKITSNKDSSHALWAKFDEDWYLKRYPDTKEKMSNCGINDAKVFYEQIGSVLGHSPNPYFDEEWYLRQYPQLKKNIDRGAFKSGFEHYCLSGYLTNDPHWLFSTYYYLKNNQDFVYDILNNDQYVNAYDHYLKIGDMLKRRGSLFFDPLIYQQQCYQRGLIEKTETPYQNYLISLPDTDKNSDVSLYFDTLWYIEKYPGVHQEIENGEYQCALHHYCVNDTPKKFNPSKWFDEQYYLETYPDIRQTIENSENFRNGYDHFVYHGTFEFRSPNKDIDLRQYYYSGNVQEEIENKIFRDVYAHYVFDNKIEEWLNKLPEYSHYRLSKETNDSRKYFQRKSKIAIPLVAHNKLDFSYEGQADICVIMLMYNHLSVTLMALASLRGNFNGKIQLLLGDNHSTDDGQYIQSCLTGAYVTHFPFNFGYGKACNELIEKVDAPITIFLNNDINLFPNAINALCQRLVSSDTIGAVGGKIIHPNGYLQEAGQIIWRDGTTSGYLRGEDPLIPEANFVRDVDYCSASMLAVKTDILQEVNGFTPIYYPAYFEDTDLCVKIIKAGYRVVYDPNAVVEHLEYASSNPIVSSGLMQRNHYNFTKEHSDFLRFQSPCHLDNVLIARQRRKNNKRILFIEDRIPLKFLGSGYIRSNDIITQMDKMGYEVTVYPINYYYPHLYQIYLSLPDTVEILFNHTIENLREFFKERAGFYDLIWIGRTHNLNRILPIMGEATRYLPQKSIILDTEVVATVRTQQQEKILGIKPKKTFDEALEEELSCARHCQEIVAVNTIDAEYIKKAGFDNVNVLGHNLQIKDSPDNWLERKNILFVGALHDNTCPNYDSLEWFLKNILPILVEKLGQDFTFSIAGYINVASVDMYELSKYPNVKFLGIVSDLSEIYNKHRIYIAPTRFAGGIPYKVHEAASYGIPVVASEILVNQLGWKNDQDILSAPIDNPEFFASQIIKLYENKDLWHYIRQNAFKRIEEDCNEKQFREQIKLILSKVLD